MEGPFRRRGGVRPTAHNEVKAPSTRCPLYPKADIRWSVRHVRFVPKADIMRRGKIPAIRSPRRRARAVSSVYVDNEFVLVRRLYPACRSQPAHRHHRAQENGHGQEGADRSPHPAPECDGEENEEWIDREPMTD